MKKLSSDELLNIENLGQLKASDYQSRTIKRELRENLIERLENKQTVFKGIYGYDDTVIPELQRAILSEHDINLLGLRGQAKTRMARLMVQLLDEYIPVIKGAELNDDPLNPISSFGLQQLEEYGDDLAVSWLHRSERYAEKLATPDVSVADLVGDVDPIKAATLKLPYSDERVIHYGLIPRSNRCVFVINELPDLQARIQVALFNILQEGDIQIRGFKLRLPLDIQFVFTANPEDYTNRGSIVTPLKDRIDSQIITHYPKDVATSKLITQQEAALKPGQQQRVESNDFIADLIEQIAFEARESEFIDEKSGVSARLTIAAYENLISAAERRALINGEKKTHVRLSDLWGVIPAITGKVELVYEGEQEGAGLVAQNLIGKAIRTYFIQYFPNPEKEKKKKSENTYKEIIDWFGNENSLDLLFQSTEQEYKKQLDNIPGLKKLVTKRFSNISAAQQYFLMEFALHGLAEYSILSRKALEQQLHFTDLLSGLFTMDDEGEEEEDFL
jgi:magnesium chelatase subunit I